MKQYELKNKVVIITGSRMGIGKSIADKLGNIGAKIVINGRNVEELKKTEQQFIQKGYDVLSVSGDVSKIKDCEKLIGEAAKRFGRIDVLINNAGLTAKGSLEKCDLTSYKRIIDVNLLGSVYMTKFALPYLRKTRGSVLFISSLGGIHGLPYYSSYSASKKALTAIAESLRLELHNQNIHVGVSFVSFTENDPDKKFYNEKGELTVLPKRENIALMPVEKTAQMIITQIQRRTFIEVHSLLGKINWIIYKRFPDLVGFFLSRNLKKFR